MAGAPASSGDGIFTMRPRRKAEGSVADRTHGRTPAIAAPVDVSLHAKRRCQAAPPDLAGSRSVGRRSLSQGRGFAAGRRFRAN